MAYRFRGSTIIAIGDGPVLHWPERDGAFGGRRHRGAVLREHARLIARSRSFPSLHATGNLFRTHFQIDRRLFNIDADDVTLFHSSDGPAILRFGSHVPHHEATRRTTEAAVGE